MYDLKKFKTPAAPTPKKSLMLTYSPKCARNKQPRFGYSATVGDTLMGFGSERYTVMLSSDKVAALVSTEDGRHIGNQSKNSNTGSFCNAAISDLVSNMYDNQPVRFKGVVDEKQHAIFFDLKQPIYL